MSKTTFQELFQAKHGNQNMMYDSSSLKHLLRQKQWFLTHKMSFLHVIVCLLGRRAHEKAFLKALLVIQGVKSELCVVFLSHSSASLPERYFISVAAPLARITPLLWLDHSE